jgi:hypothetical protein
MKNVKCSGLLHKISRILCQTVEAYCTCNNIDGLRWIANDTQQGHVLACIDATEQHFEYYPKFRHAVMGLAYTNSNAIFKQDCFKTFVLAKFIIYT